MSIVSVLTAKPPMDSIPSLLDTEGTEVRIQDWKAKAPSSLWIHGAYCREGDSGYPFVVYPPHYDVPYRSDEPSEITQSRVLPSALPLRTTRKTDVNNSQSVQSNSNQQNPIIQSIQSLESMPVQQKSIIDHLKEMTWSAELNTDSCLIYLTHLVLQKVIFRDSISLQELTKEIYPTAPRGLLVLIFLISSFS